VRKISLAALFIIQSVFVFAQSTIYTPATVPNQKLVDNGYVSNPDNIISGNAVAQINASLAGLESQTSAQVSVVVIRTIGDADIFNFAQELYNLWGIGQSNSNGLLILLVEDLHTVRFHTGVGLEGTLPDAVCKQIQRDQMVPSFKAGDYDTGMINGVTEVVKILTDPAYANELQASSVAEETVDPYTGFVWFVGILFLPIFLIAWAVKSGKFADSKPADPTDFPQMRLKRSTWLIEFGLIPMLIVVLWWVVPTAEPIGNGMISMYAYLMFTVFHRVYRERKMVRRFTEKQKFYELTEYFRRSTFYWLVMGLIFPFPFLLLFPVHLVRKKLFRNHSRKCKSCNGEMKKLDEINDDNYLTKAQIVEEQISSVDYDVWQCQACQATEFWHFPNRFSKYSECPSCKAKAYYRASSRTVKSATYSSSGKGEETHECKACGKKTKSTYTIAQLTSSSSSSSSSGSSFSSSSSSSGGSWGGGHSGGGGASSSW
jgi:uncharacterized protein